MSLASPAAFRRLVASSGPSSSSPLLTAALTLGSQQHPHWQPTRPPSHASAAASQPHHHHAQLVLLRRAYHSSRPALASLPPRNPPTLPVPRAEAHIQPRAATHYPDSYTGPTHLVSAPPKAGYGDVGKGWTGKDYSKGPSALDKAAELFFFTE